MTDNALHQLHAAGQSIWLDYIDRSMLSNGDLDRRIHEDSLTGMTSNPTIFEKALAEGSVYDDQIRSATAVQSTMELFELIATTDVRNACDAFAGVFASTNGADGFVSIEVSPSAANNRQATVAEAQRLWATVKRPNVMIKVPGTAEGAMAVEQLIAAGINVNITLLFSLDAYSAVIESYVRGLEQRVKEGKDVSAIHSVASFFISRVDSEVDKRLDAAGAPTSLHGKAAVANAKQAYRLFRQHVASPRWLALAARGATLQRPLWASTSTKNPAYRDVMYVEELIGPDTVNTMPPQTIDAFRDHGRVERTADRNLDEADRDIQAIAHAGVSMPAVTDKLLADGLASFEKSFDTLIARLAAKTKSLGQAPFAGQR